MGASSGRVSAPESTLDVDRVVALTEAEIEPAALGAEFHAGPRSLRRAVRETAGANVIHPGTSTKVDLFVAGSPVT